MYVCVTVDERTGRRRRELLCTTRCSIGILEALATTAHSHTQTYEKTLS